MSTHNIHKKFCNIFTQSSLWHLTDITETSRPNRYASVIWCWQYLSVKQWDDVCSLETILGKGQI